MEVKIIREMTTEGATSKIQVEIDHFLLYRKSKVGVITGKLVEPLLSQGQIFVKAGDDCKVKLKIEILDFTKLRNVKICNILPFPLAHWRTMFCLIDNLSVSFVR